MRPRIEPLRREDASPEVAKLYEYMDALGNPPPNMHLTFGKNANLYSKWLPFATYVIPASSLTPRDRQILILRSAFSWRCGYAWAQHVRISQRLSALGENEISALEDVDERGWDEKESALIRACDDAAGGARIGDDAWAVLARHYSEQELLDIVFTIGQYALIAIALNSISVELDEGFSLPSWAAVREVTRN